MCYLFPITLGRGPLSLPLILLLVAASNSTQENPLLKYQKSELPLPLCYQTHNSRMNRLKGNFQSFGNRDHLPTYWNFSCPLELSKHSCSHQGKNLTHALYAASLRFIPADCFLLAGDELLPYLANMKIHIKFMGNSLVRQLLHGLACQMHAMGLVERFDIIWNDCTKNPPYPCHGTLNCLTCGEHSATHDYNIHLVGGGSLEHIFEPPDVMRKLFREDIGDLIIAQPSDTYEVTRGMKALIDFRKNNTSAALKPLPKLIWMGSYSSLFPTHGDLFKDEGAYNLNRLKELQAKHKPLDCIRGTDSGGPSSEQYEKVPGWDAEGFIFLDGTNMCGEAKVGLGVGRYGDCHHFCEPGPIDEWGRALAQLIISLFNVGV